MSTDALLAPATLELGRIHQGDCLDLMRQIESGTIDLVFADPPFNIGYQYDQYHDEQDDEEYVAWSRAWMAPAPSASKNDRGRRARRWI